MMLAASAYAVEPISGSRNFTPPRSVPDYFSNESGPFHDRAAGRAAQPGSDRFITGSVPSAAAAPARHHQRKVSASSARAKHRGKHARSGPTRHRHAVRAHVSSKRKAGVGRRPSKSSRTAARDRATARSAKHTVQASR
jgi:hypothetical protein